MKKDEVPQYNKVNDEPISLRKACVNDLLHIHNMQIESFLDLLNRYNDPDTNPAAEPLEAIQRRFNQRNSDYYLICHRDIEIGVIRVATNQERSEARISPMFIIPQYQNRGFGFSALSKIEAEYSSVTKWELDTVKEEEMLCHFYRKAGYIEVGEPKIIKPGQTLQFFEKSMNSEKPR